MSRADHVEADASRAARRDYLWIIPTALAILGVSGWCMFQIIRFFQPKPEETP